MNKGFVITLVSLSVFIIAILLLGNINNGQIDTNYSQEFLDAKIKITNYELLLNQVAQDCNWTQIDVNECINTNSIKIINSLELNTFPLTCTNTVFLKNGDSFKTTVNCNEELITDQTLFTLNITKPIIVKKLN